MIFIEGSLTAKAIKKFVTNTLSVYEENIQLLSSKAQVFRETVFEGTRVDTNKIGKTKS